MYERGYKFIDSRTHICVVVVSVKCEEARRFFSQWSILDCGTKETLTKRENAEILHTAAVHNFRGEENHPSDNSTRSIFPLSKKNEYNYYYG